MRLQKEGKINAAYSAHDFRHYFAVSEYQKDKDIYKLSKLLDHTNISITETYLKSLKIEI
jgi:integrase/recombinase XerD